MTERIYNYFPKEYDAQIADCILINYIKYLKKNI